jgi:hypothetical protein
MAGRFLLWRAELNEGTIYLPIYRRWPENGNMCPGASRRNFLAKMPVGVTGTLS